MNGFENSVTKVFDKVSGKNLERGLIACLRETKLNSATKPVTKYLSINIIEGPPKAVNSVKEAMDQFLTNLNASFEIQSKIDMTPSTFEPKL